MNISRLKRVLWIVIWWIICTISLLSILQGLSNLPAILQQNGNNDDVTILTTLGYLVGRRHMTPLVNFNQEYAPGFHYITSFAMHYLGFNAHGLSLATEIIQLALFPILIFFTCRIIGVGVTISFCTTALCIFFGPWVGFKGIFMLCATMASLFIYRNFWNRRFEFFGVIFGILTLFAQEFGVYLGTTFCCVILLEFMHDNSALRTRAQTAFRSVFKLFFGFLIILIPTMVFYGYYRSLGAYFTYDFKIAFGVQASYMKLPFCFDCGALPRLQVLSFYVIIFAGLLVLLCLLDDSFKYKRVESLLFLVFFGFATLTTAMGRSTSANITLGEIVLFTVEVLYAFEFLGSRKMISITTISLFLCSLVLELLILINSIKFGKFQFLLIPTLIIIAKIIESKPMFAKAITSTRYANKGILILLLAPLVLVACNFFHSDFPSLYKNLKERGLASVTPHFVVARHEDSTQWILSSLNVPLPEAEQVLKTYISLPMNSKFVFPRPVSLYLLDAGNNPTKNYLFARYFDATSGPSGVIGNLEQKQIQYIFLEKSLAATASEHVYTYILQNYHLFQNFGDYEVWARNQVLSKSIELSRIVNGFEPQTKVPEYIYANYLKPNFLGNNFTTSTFTNPPYAECIQWSDQSVLTKFPNLLVQAVANPNGAQTGSISIGLTRNSNLVQSVRQTSIFGGKTFTFRVPAGDSFRLCSNIANGTYWDIHASS